MGIFFKSKKKTVRRPKKTQTRTVYLMERKTAKEPESRGLREIKIGVSNDEDRRNREVDKGIPGDVDLLDAFVFPEATRIESSLDRLFKDWNFKPRGAKTGAGGTEFYRMTDAQVKALRQLLRANASRVKAKRIKPAKPAPKLSLFWLLFWGILAVVLIHYLNGNI